MYELGINEGKEMICTVKSQFRQLKKNQTSTGMKPTKTYKVSYEAIMLAAGQFVCSFFLLFTVEDSLVAFR